MKRILLITTTPFYKEKGSSLRIYSIAKILGQKYKVDLVTYSLGKNIEIPNVTIYKTPSFFKPSIEINSISVAKILLDVFVVLKCLVLLMKNSYQIVHCEDFEAAFVGRFLVTFFSKKTLVYDLHNRVLDNLDLKNKAKNKIFRATALRLESYVVNKCDLIILNWNKYLKDPIFKNKRTLLYYDQIELSAIEKYPLPDKKYFVYSGNFEPYQGLKELLEVYNKCVSDYKIVLIGEPSEEITNLIKKEPKLANDVILTGRLNIGQSNYLISNALAGILSRLEGSSMKVIHYLMLNKSVIAKDTESNKELLIDNSNSLLYSNSVSLKKILEAKDLEKEFAKMAGVVSETKKEIMNNWSQSEFIKNYEQIT